MMILLPSVIAMLISIGFTVLAVTHPQAVPIVATIVVGLVVAGLFVWSSLSTRSH